MYVRGDSEFRDLQTAREGTGACFFTAAIFLGLSGLSAWLGFDEDKGFFYWMMLWNGPIMLGAAMLLTFLGSVLAARVKKMNRLRS